MNSRIIFIMVCLALGMLFHTTAKADTSTCLKSFYAMIATEFDKAYVEQGKPKLSFDNLAKVKDMGLSRLEANASQWPRGATFSTSVLDDYVSIAVFCDSKMKKGEWRPK